MAHTVAISGQSLLLGANAPNFGSMYVMLDEFHQPPRRRTDRQCDRRRLARPLRRRGSRGPGLDLRRSARRRPGQRRRLQTHGRGPRQPGTRRSPGRGRQRRRRRRSHAGIAGRLHQPPRRHALALPRHRSAQGQVDGRVAHRSVQRAAGLCGLALRQQLQRVRPLLAGQRPGRRAASAAPWKTSCRSRSATTRARWSP